MKVHVTTTSNGVATTVYYNHPGNYNDFKSTTIPHLIAEDKTLTEVRVEFRRREGWQPDEVLRQVIDLSRYVPDDTDIEQGNYLPGCTLVITYDYDTVLRTALKQM